MMRKCMRHIFLVLIGMLLLSPSLHAQDVHLRSSLDTTSILVGAQTNVRINVDCAQEVKVQWPEIGDTLRKEIEVLEKSAIDTVLLEEGKVSYRQALRITSFDSGYYAIPPFRFVIDVDGIQEELETMANLLEVHTVKVDTSQHIRDIAPIREVPVTFVEVISWVVPGIVGVALLFLLYLFLKRRKRREPLALSPRKLVIPPHKQALDALYDLKDRKLWQKGDLKGFYQGITDILRLYFEQEFGFLAVEMSTTDIAEQVALHPVLKPFHGRIVTLFSEADLVKFAKSVPEPEAHERSWEEAKQLVSEAHQAEVLARQQREEANREKGKEVSHVA